MSLLYLIFSFFLSPAVVCLGNDLNYLNIVDYLDVTVNLLNDTYKPFSKTNCKISYIYKKPNLSLSIVFLSIIFNKHFQPHHIFSKIFNRKNMKVSCSCMKIIKARINLHNKAVASPQPSTQARICNPIVPLKASVSLKAFCVRQV